MKRSRQQISEDFPENLDDLEDEEGMANIFNNSVLISTFNPNLSGRTIL